jgi:hypothetical protein
MADALRVTLELGPEGKRVVAVAPDWPGLERGAKTEEEEGSGPVHVNFCTPSNTEMTLARQLHEWLAQYEQAWSDRLDWLDDDL